MAEQVPDEVKSERLYRLQAAIDRHQAAFNARCVGRTFDVLFEKPGRHPGQLVGRSPYLQPVQVMAASSMIGEIAAVTITEISANSLFGALGGREPAGQRADAGGRRRLIPLRTPRSDNGFPSPAAVGEDAATQVVLAFDDNRLASILFGQYGQNLALIERRLGVVAEQRGNHVTIEGSRDACEQARRVLEGLYERLKRGDELVSGDVEGAIRLAIAQGSLFDYDPATARPSFEEINLRKRPVRARTAAQDAYIRALRRHALVFGTGPGRHRQDLARGRACGAAVRAQGGRPHHPVAAGGRGRRAARLPARRHAREGRSLSAADLRRALRPDGRAHRRARAADRRDSRSRRSPSCAGARCPTRS